MESDRTVAAELVPGGGGIDLSIQAVNKFWQTNGDPLSYRIICTMELLENWVLDDDQKLDEALEALGKSLKTVGDELLDDKEQVIRILANIKFGRMVRLLQGLDVFFPGTSTQLLVFAEKMAEIPSKEARLFLQRHLLFERLRILGRVFSEERLDSFLVAVGTYE